MKLTKLSLFAIIVFLCGFAGQSAQSAPIEGAITFRGGAVFDTNSLATVTRVDAFSNVKVVSEDGDYSAFVSAGDAVAMATPWIFSPSTATPGLWSVGGFTFDLATATMVFQSSDFLFIQGEGSVSGNGFDETPGSFSFSTQAPNSRGIFSFSASSASVPEHGTTLALLGIGLVGLEILRRRVAFGR